MEPEAAGAMQVSLPVSIVLDVTVVCILYVARVALLAGALTLTSKREADVRLKKCALVAVFLILVYFLANTTPEAVLSIRAFLLATLIGTFLCMKLFWTSLEAASVAGLLFCALSTLMGSYAERGLDHLLPGRTTIGRTLTAAIDERVRRTAQDASLPATTGVMPAALRLAMTPGSDGVVDALMSPLRTAQNAKAQIADIGKLKAEEASIVNMLSGAGTNVGNRADELAALQQGLSAEAAQGGLPSAAPAAPPAAATTPAAQALATAPAAPAPVPKPAPAPAPAVPPPAPVAARSVKSPAGPAAPAAAPPPAAAVVPRIIMPVSAAFRAAVAPEPESAPSPADTAASSTAVVAATPKLPPPGPATVSVVTAVAGPSAPLVHPNVVSGLDRMPPADRQRWDAARQLLRVSAVGWSGGGAYVVIKGRKVHVGNIHKVVSQGREYTFRFRGLGMQGTCKWDPVVTKDEPETGFIAF